MFVNFDSIVPVMACDGLRDGKEGITRKIDRATVLKQTNKQYAWILQQ